MLDSGGLQGPGGEQHSGPRQPDCGRIGGYWACVSTKPRAERTADFSLRSLGHRSYLPLYLASAGVLRPLFPRYLFVEHTPNTPSSPMRYAPGVSGLLRAGLSLLYAAQGVVEQLLATEEARQRPPDVRALWSPGDACVIAEGPFQGHHGSVLEVGRHYVTLAVMMFGGLRDVMVQPGQIRRRDA